MTHPIKGYGPSLGDQGVDPDDRIHTERVANCPGCEVEWDDRLEPGGLPTIRYCADHDPAELRGLLDDAEAAAAALRRALAFIANEADPSHTPAPHVGGAPVDYHNCVVHADLAGLAPDEVDATIEAAIARFRAHGVPGTWHVGPSTRPAELGERLLAHGFAGGGGDRGMAADLSTLAEDVPAPPDLAVTRVRDRQDLATWARIRALDPEGELESAWVAEMYARIGLGDETPWRHYLGRLGPRPVATATLFLGAGVAGVYFVLTVPEARRRGVGAAVTLAALREARALGYRTGVLGASDLGYPLYRRLGFREYCRIRVYEWTTSG
jgi:GNAT superfamily N-acetyltransferase